MRYALAFALLAACCPYTDAAAPMHFDEEWTEPELAVLSAAMTEWAVALDVQLGPMVYGHPHGLDLGRWASTENVVHRLREEEPITQALRTVSCNFAGMASWTGPIAIAVDVLDSPWALRHVMLHELGHHYGHCEHSEAPSLMVGSIGADLDCIDAATVEVVCDSQDCGPDAGGTCP